MKPLPLCQQCGINPVGHKRRATCYDCVPKRGNTPKLCELCRTNPVAYARRSSCFACVPQIRKATPLCAICERNPVAYQNRETCYDCVPRKRPTPLRCKRCGSEKDYFRAGLCRRCHRRAPVRDSCRQCFAWGVTRRRDWLCEACRGWDRRFNEKICPSCKRLVPLNERGFCRLCCRQAHLVRLPHQTIDVIVANTTGQQLFLADMARNKEPPLNEAPSITRQFNSLPELPVAHEQLVCFEVRPDLSVRSKDDLVSIVRGLTDFFDQAVADHGTKHGWSEALQSATRRSIHLLISAQHTPGRRIRHSEIEWLQPLQLFTMTLVREVLISIDMFEDDSEAPLESWFRQEMADVHPQMVQEVAEWFHAIRDGRTCIPRRRKRNVITVRQNVDGLKEPLKHWTNVGYTSLREVERNDILKALPDNPHRQHQTAGALRSLFRFLKANKTTFINPTARVKAAPVPVSHPIPMDVGLVQRAFGNDNPAGAAMAAIVIFHGLSTSELTNILLADVHDSHLELPRRTVVLADAASKKIAAWLDVRNERWPATINPHLFINKHTALRLTPVSRAWISQRLEIPVRELREDRIVNEAIASSGDARALGDLFGLTTLGAERYTRAIEQDAHFSS